MFHLRIFWQYIQISSCRGNMPISPCFKNIVWKSAIAYRADSYTTISQTVKCYVIDLHYDVIKWKHFPRYWPFARGIHRSQRPVMRSFDVVFDLCLNKCLSKQSWGWWFETPSCPLWRHCGVTMSLWSFRQSQLSWWMDRDRAARHNNNRHIPAGDKGKNWRECLQEYAIYQENLRNKDHSMP